MATISRNIKPIFPPTPIPCPSNPSTEPQSTQNLISTLNLSPHPEGGYFVETDRNPLRIANPYHSDCNNVDSINKHNDNTGGTSTDVKNDHPENGDGENGDRTRAASSSIFYLITPRSPRGAFHRNRSRTVHTIHRGRGRYVIIRADRAAREGRKAMIDSFVVGPRIDHGEQLQWIVDGGEYKASYLLPDDDDGGESSGLLISETVVPGFEAADHDFLTLESMNELLTDEQTRELAWLLTDHES
ncbi:RmlC-like cupin domain-containing protein [Aspergillus pseudoustus]|uniref:RmlC-like cupin domain-containing protein n=1 Tax=Aspergillus pseudoustus TaxID=1810923 RepID=A0ABR4JLR0_9EURO